MLLSLAKLGAVRPLSTGPSQSSYKTTIAWGILKSKPETGNLYSGGILKLEDARENMTFALQGNYATESAKQRNMAEEAASDSRASCGRISLMTG